MKVEDAEVIGNLRVDYDTMTEKLEKAENGMRLTLCDCANGEELVFNGSDIQVEIVD